MSYNENSVPLPNTPIAVLSNKAIIDLMRREYLSIDNFDSSKLGSTSYKIFPRSIRVKYIGDDYESLDRECVLTDKVVYELKPGQQVIVYPIERFNLSPGLYVDFFPASFCIENSLQITVGRLDYGYSGNVVFGLFNAGAAPIELNKRFDLVRASIGWMGLDNMPEYGNNPNHMKHLAELENRRKLQELEQEKAHIESQIKLLRDV